MELTMCNKRIRKLYKKLNNVTIGNGYSISEVEAAQKHLNIFKANKTKKKPKPKSREQRRLIRETMYEEIVYRVISSDTPLKLTDIYRSSEMFSMYSYSYFYKIFKMFSNNDNRINVITKIGVGTFCEKNK